MLGMSRVRAASHWMALAVAICRRSLKQSLQSNCTPRYLMLFFHSISFSLRTIFGYAPITSLRISFGTPSVPGAVFALSLPPALFSSSRVKSSARRTTQELRSCLWNGCMCGNKLRTMYLTRSAWGLSSSHQSLSDYFEGDTPWVFLDIPDQVFPALKSDFLYALSQS